MRLQTLVKRVAIAHCIVIAYCIISLPSWKEPRPRRKIAVRTVTLKEKRPELIISKKQVVKKSPELPQKKVKKSKLIAAAAKSLKQLQTKTKTTSSNPIHTPTQIISLQVDSTHEALYIEKLISALQFLLKLPENEEVTVSLTLDSEGNIAKLESIASQSSANKKYVQQTLKGAKLPPYGSHFGNADTHTFQLNLLPDE